MRKLLAAATLACMAFAAPAYAADLPVKAPPVVIPALYNWTGLYIGVEGGAVQGQNTDWHLLNVNLNPILTPGPQPAPLFMCFPSPPGIPGNCANVGHPLHGGFAGGEIGFNWQAVGSRWVFGVEADANWAQLEEALTCPNPHVSCGSKINDFETVRARIGYAFGPHGDFLLYVTGGWATANVDAFEANLFPVVLPNGTVTFPQNDDWQRQNGFVVGGGFEYGITSWLSLKGEAAYVWLQGKDHCFSAVAPVAGNLNGGCTNRTVTATGGDPATIGVIAAHVAEDFVLFRMGLNARFWWGKAPTPVVARY
jgi:outer membrane immunogenic protein